MVASVDQYLYRFEANGIGIYAAVERDCPRDDERRIGKPDGAWLPHVGPNYPGAISLFTETGLAKYWGSGLMHWHASVTRSPISDRRGTHSGAAAHRDRFQLITDPETISFQETLELFAPLTPDVDDLRGTIFWDFDATLAVSSPLWVRAARSALDDLTPNHGFDLTRLKALVDSVFPWHRANDHHIIEAAENLRYALANPYQGVDRCRGWLFSALEALT